ncbi:hypothetical protein DVQ81_04405 [Yersinia enterocolitica]|nr:hypothetical protein [Yersinia enterocolitica]
MDIVRLSLSSIEIDYLNKEFPTEKFSLYSTDGDSKISCFVCWIDSCEILSRNWKGIVSFIAGSYQTSLTEKYSVWNIYVVFMCKDSVSKQIKYRIENDRFAMRKIIYDIDNYYENLDEIEKILNNDILGFDLNLQTPDSNDISSLVEKSIFGSFIEELGEIPLDGKDESIQIRQEKVKLLLDRVQKYEIQKSRD